MYSSNTQRARYVKAHKLNLCSASCLQDAGPQIADPQVVEAQLHKKLPFSASTVEFPGMEMPFVFYPDNLLTAWTSVCRYWHVDSISNISISDQTKLIISFWSPAHMLISNIQDYKL